MIEYPHKVHTPLIEEYLEDYKSDDVGIIWRKINEGMRADYVFGVAIIGFWKAQAVAWAMQDLDALDVFLERNDGLHRIILDQFSQEELWANSDMATFLSASTLTDPELFVEYAKAYVGKPHVDRENRTSSPVTRHFLDAYVAFILGDDAKAETAIEYAQTALDQPDHPPTTTFQPVIDLINATLNRDQQQLDISAQALIDAHAKVHAPTRTQHASPLALIEPHLILLNRINKQRGLTIPPNPYTLTHNQP